MNYRGLAANYLSGAEQRDDESGVKLNANDLRQCGAAYAMLAVAQELNRLRDAVKDVADKLDGPGASDAGTSLYYISDWLKGVVEKQ
ncbi:hypothetical protein [Micromonospora sp. WMMD710]|uniref:hypothetical protein n=1 Tax=Micromonospora sp. WMMD710 TaxID=3016085 RepID=UPI002416FE14|nr:hypothetical protein [Micromonospora sp. WMMD710]MDG4760604.1 hypothetical protein [Micromonospora sp. WMMD710]